MHTIYLIINDIDIVGWHNWRNKLSVKLSMSDLHEALRSEQNGLCAISGAPLDDNFHIQSIDPLKLTPQHLPIFEDKVDHLVGISPSVNVEIGRYLDELAIKWALPGMRESGNVRRIGNFYIAEYESRNLRLEELEQDMLEISKLVNTKFILYDYKATIRSDSQEALDYLKRTYKTDISVARDILFIDDLAMSLKPITKSAFIDHAKKLWKSINNPNKDKSEHSVTDIDTSENLIIKDKDSIEPALGVDLISETLANICPELIKDSGMMVGIFGNWGRGKTFLAKKIISKIRQNNKNWYFINFSAWKYQHTESSWSHLHDSILRELERDTSIFGRIKNLKNRAFANGHKKGMLGLYLNIFLIIFLACWVFAINKIDLILGLAGFITTATVIFFVKTFIFFNSSSGYFKKIKQNYFSQDRFKSNLGIQAEIEDSLVAMLKSWIPKGSQSKLILFVDDIDRCDVRNVLDVIDGLRLILDNPEIYNRVVIISAIDERILKHAIRIKYNGVDNSTLDDIYAEYLQKIFIIGIKLDHLCEQESKDFLDKLIPDFKACYSRQPELDVLNTLHGLIEGATQEAIDVQNYTEQLQEIYSNSQSSTQDPEKLTGGELEKEITEISKSEHTQLTKSIVNLNERTPRSIKIFYYKYLISKKLLIESLREKNLIDKWNESKHEEQLIEHLIAIANKEPIEQSYKNVYPDVDEVIKKTATLVSAI